MSTRRKRQSIGDNLGGDGGFGNGGARLGDWRKAGSIVVFLHAESGITPRLFHLIPYVEKSEDSGKKELRYYPFICHEEPSSYFARAPAQHCPICRAIDMLVDDDSIDDDTIVFEISPSNKQHARKASKLDFCGLKGGDWRGSFKPRAQYVIGVINTEKPEAGIQVDVEPQSLGDALMSAIKKEIDSSGQEAGDPRINPYAFKFTYDADADPKDKYDAYSFRRAEYTEQIAELMEKPAVDIDGYIDPGDTKRLREIMEAHVDCVDLDVIFDNVLDVQSDSSDEEPESEEDNLNMGNLCETCDGKGTIGKKKTECPDCEGTGRDAPEEVEEIKGTPCETCNGTGKIGKKNKECPDCEGSGIDTTEEESEEDEEETVEMIDCETCNGTGKIGKKKKTCPECDGEGVVPAEEDDNETPEEEEEPEAEEKKEEDKAEKKESAAEKKARIDEEKKEEKRQRERDRRAKKKAEKEAAEAAANTEPKDASEEEEEAECKCGGCQRLIPESASTCPFCGAEFGDDDTEEESDESSEED